MSLHVLILYIGISNKKEKQDQNVATIKTSILTNTLMDSCATCFKISSTHWSAIDDGDIISVAPD